MKENNNEWFAGESDAEGLQIITRGKLFAQREASRFPYRIEVQWHYKGDAKGMPSDEESERMDSTMNLLQQRLEGSGYALLTAIHLGASQSLYVYYVSNIDKFSETLDSAFGSLPPLPIQIGAESDPTWSDYNQMLQKFGMQ